MFNTTLLSELILEYRLYYMMTYDMMINNRWIITFVSCISVSRRSKKYVLCFVSSFF